MNEVLRLWWKILKCSTDPGTIQKVNVEQGILNIELMNRCAPLFLSTDGHFHIHDIDIRSAFAMAMAGQVLDIPAPFKAAS